MDAGQILAAAASGSVVLGAAIGVLRWLIVHEVRAVGEQLRPNGGKSFRDHFDSRLNSVQSHLRAQDTRMDGVDGRLDGIDGRLEGIDDRLNTAADTHRADRDWDRAAASRRPR